MGSVNLGQVAAFIDSVSVESIAEGATPTVRNEGTASNARFVFGLPTDSGAAAAQSRQAANESEASSLISEGHAVGQQNGVNVDSSSPYYHNNSKYYSEQAATSATSAAASEERTRNMLSTKQDVLTFDSAPTSGSINPVTSGGVFSALANLGGYKVVPSLASVTEPDEKTIYLVKDSSATGSDKYEEYIWQVEQGVGGWEKIGDTSLDLSPYVQKTDLATANTAGIVKPDGTTITVDANGVLSGASLLTFEQEDFNNNLGNISLTPERRAFTGTRAEWNALSAAQKATYKTVNITDDEGEYIVPTQIVAASTTITGSPLKANTTMQVMFSANIAGVDGTTQLVVTYNGTQIPVKAHKGGQLIPVYAKEIAASTFRYIDAYTTLQLFYDGTNFVIVGNPLLLSSDTYSIYANGYNDFVNNCELSDFEDITISTSASSPTEMPYDGYIYLSGSTDTNVGVSRLYVNDIKVAQFESSGWVSNYLYTNFKKGDKIYTSGWRSLTTPQKVRYYKKRDYSNR